MKDIFKKIITWIFGHKEEIQKAVETVTYVVKNKELDGDVDIQDIFDIVNLIKESGLTSTPESESLENVFNLGNLQELQGNSIHTPIEYDQTSWSCVFYAVGRMIMYNTTLVFSKDEHELVKKRGLELGLWKDGDGTTFVNGLKIWQTYVKEKYGVNLYYIREAIGSQEYNRIKDLGYMSIIGGYITNEYIRDIKNNGVIDEEYTFKESKKYGHCFTDYKNIRNEIDNYPTKFKENNKRTNTIQQLFVKHGYYFTHGYFMFEEQDVKIDVEKAKDTLITSDLQKALELGIIKNEDLDKPCLRQDAARMVVRALNLASKK